MCIVRQSAFAVIALFLARLEVGEARAGGFDRLTQDVSLLFDSSATVLDSFLGYAVPFNSYDTVNGVPTDVPLSTGFPLYALNLKFTPSDRTACLISGSRPFGNDIDHGRDWTGAQVVIAQHLAIDELGLTCSVSAPLAGMTVRAIGGVTRDSAGFSQSAVAIGAPKPADTTSVQFDGTAWSWRSGLAIENASTGFMTSLIYYAPIEFDLDGRIEMLPLGQGQFLSSVPIEGHAAMPQALELSLRGLIAPGWLAGTSIKWMDWSKFSTVPFTASATVDPIPNGAQIINFKTYFRDGLTASAFLSHALDQNWSVTVKGIWDRGVGTGWTEDTESWTLIGNVRHRLSQSIEVSAGVGLIWLTAGELNKSGEGAPFDATFPGSLAIVPHMSLTNRF